MCSDCWSGRSGRLPRKETAGAQDASRHRQGPRGRGELPPRELGNSGLPVVFLYAGNPEGLREAAPFQDLC